MITDGKETRSSGGLRRRVLLVTGMVGVIGQLATSLDAANEHAAADWPQWLGPNRDGVSATKGLLTTWPEAGPVEVWRKEIGRGFSGVSVFAGNAYTMTMTGDGEYAIGLDALTGKELWRTRTGPIYRESQGGDGPRGTPAIDGGLVYVLGANGALEALDAARGTRKWAVDLKKDFGSQRPGWGFSSSPLIEGSALLVEGGGSSGRAIMGFNKRDGRPLWSTQGDKMGYSSPVVANFGGVRQVLFFTGAGLTSVSPLSGSQHWRFEWPTPYDVNVATPVLVPPDKVFISSGYDTGGALLKVSWEAGKATVRQVWKDKVMKSHFGTAVYYDGYLYGFDMSILKCVDANTGVEMWKERGYGKGTLIIADGHLIVLSERGKVALIKAQSNGFVEVASAQVLNGKCWTVPSLADGRLYLRNEQEIVCLDLVARS